MPDIPLTTSAITCDTQPAEQRVVFHHLPWNSYQQILQVLNNHSRNSRLTYDCGILEITMPLEKHETANRLIELFIRILVTEMDLEIKTMGSTTLTFPGLQKSAEPDSCYYIQNQSKVAGKEVNLTCDPPPDLVVEIDITNTDIDKLQLYASMGVPEFWRYNGRIWQIYQRQGSQYTEVEHSPTFPWVEKAQLYQFLEQCKMGEVAAEKNFRRWVQARD
jgi:Uma2 family endonuclease